MFFFFSLLLEVRSQGWGLRPGLNQLSKWAPDSKAHPCPPFDGNEPHLLFAPFSANFQKVCKIIINSIEMLTRLHMQLYLSILNTLYVVSHSHSVKMLKYTGDRLDIVYNAHCRSAHKQFLHGHIFRQLSAQTNTIREKKKRAQFNTVYLPLLSGHQSPVCRKKNRC